MMDQAFVRLMGLQAALSRNEEQRLSADGDEKFVARGDELEAAVREAGAQFGMTEHDFNIVQYLGYLDGTEEAHFGIAGVCVAQPEDFDVEDCGDAGCWFCESRRAEYRKGGEDD